MRRASPLLLCLGLLWPTAALASSPPSSPALSAGEQKAVHVLSTARVFADPTAEAAALVNPTRLRAAINHGRVKIAILPSSAAPSGAAASSVAEVLLGAIKAPDVVMFALVGREFGAAAGAASGLTSAQASAIAHETFAAHQTGGFTAANVETVLETSTNKVKAAQKAPPSPGVSPSAPGEQIDQSDSSSSSVPVPLVIGAVVVVVAIVIAVAVMSARSRRALADVIEDAPAVPAPWDLQPDFADLTKPISDVPSTPSPAAPPAESWLTDSSLEDTGQLPVLRPEPVYAPLGDPPRPFASPDPLSWTGGEWEQDEPVDA